MLTWFTVFALLTTPAPQADLNTARPALDAAGRPVPGHFTVTICRGTFYDMTPRNARGRDLYTTPHDVRITSTSGDSARGGEQGTNGTIRLRSGGSPLAGPLGATAIEYDIFDDAGRRVEHVAVRVNVIDCPPPAQARPASSRTPTHRTTSCAACQNLATQLNAASDKGVPAEVTRLAAALDACEKTCATRNIVDNDNAQYLGRQTQSADAYAYARSWTARFGMGFMTPKGQLGLETSSGWKGSAAIGYRPFSNTSFLFRVDYSKFAGAELMPDGFSASQTTLNIDTVYQFGENTFVPYVTGGVGMSRNSLDFGESSSGSWKPGFSVGGGVDYRLSDRAAIGTELRYQKFDTFSAFGATGTLKFGSDAPPQRKTQPQAQQPQQQAQPKLSPWGTHFADYGMIDAGASAPMPRGRFGDEVDRGKGLGVGVKISSEQTGLGFRFALSHASFPNDEAMPDDFSASRTALSIETVYSFGDDDQAVSPYVGAGIGIARTTLNFDSSSVSEWKPGFNASAGVDYRFLGRIALGTGVMYEDYGNFDSFSAGVHIKFRAW